MMDIHDILRHLPHRFPFLMVDRVVECVPGERLAGVKNVSINEPYFDGHFPQRPVMPGVLILEAMAQACGLLAFQTQEHQPEGEQPNARSIFYLVGIEKARFKQPVEPGDQLWLSARFDRNVRGVWMFTAESRVQQVLVAQAQIRCTMREFGA